MGANKSPGMRLMGPLAHRRHGTSRGPSSLILSAVFVVGFIYVMVQLVPRNSTIDLGQTLLHDARLPLHAASCAPTAFQPADKGGRSVAPLGATEAGAPLREEAPLVEEPPAMRRFAAAVERAEAAGEPVVADCPEALAVGLRPSRQPAREWGNACEPWAPRPVVTLLDALLGEEGVEAALEWGAGSGTHWLARRSRQLVTIEHGQRQADLVAEVMRIALPSSASRWSLHVVPPTAAPLTFLQAESAEHYFRAYSQADAQLGAREGAWDLLVVGGAARAGCLARAVHALRPQGGVLVLLHSQRPAYAAAREAVPARWARFVAGDATGEATAWVSCEEGSCGASGRGPRHRHRESAERMGVRVLGRGGGD